MKIKKICVVGLGSIGRRHCKVLKAHGFEEIIGVDLRDDRLQQAKIDVGVEYLSKNLTEVLTQKQVDTVFITLPTAYHTGVMREAVTHGCNLFIEKPVAATLDGLNEILLATNQKKICTHVAYCYRYAPSVQRLKSIIDASTVGKVLSVRLHISTYLPDWHPWEDYRDFYMAKIDQGGGARLDESHGIDLLRWLFGDVDNLFARVGTVSDLEITSDDLTVMLIEFKNKIVAEAHFDLLGRSPRIGMEVIGSEGTVLWDRISGKIELYDAKTKSWDVENFGPDDFVKSYDLQIENVIDCFARNQSTACDLQDGIQTLKVLDAALESSQKQRVIKLL